MYTKHKTFARRPTTNIFFKEEAIKAVTEKLKIVKKKKRLVNAFNRMNLTPKTATGQQEKAAKTLKSVKQLF